MKILFIGDIMGRSGREALETHLPVLQEHYEPDVTIVNGENAAHGKGITPKICKSFLDMGIDVITSGNHIWDQREIIPYIAQEERLLRPMNLPTDNPGNGYIIHRTPMGQKILIINAMGRLFMQMSDNPFAVVKELVETHKMGHKADAIFIDFHAEATSEKMAFAHYMDGQVSAIIGTHTHIPTADHHILEKGTTYMTDAGMTGDYHSVIGVERSSPIEKFVRHMPAEKFKPADGESTLCGALVETDDNTGLATSIKPIRRGGRLGQVG